MNLTAYKGFSITGQNGRFFFPAGSSDGYATMNHVKGAITKYLAHMGVADASALYKPSTPVEASIEGSEETGPPEVSSKLSHVFAEMRYYGMDKEKDTRSRNKREGEYAGKGPAGRGKVFHWRTGHGAYKLVSLKEVSRYLRNNG